MEPHNPLIGKQIGNYRILAEINSGSFGSVYQGKHIIFDTDPVVAIKLLRTVLRSPQEHIEFIKEVQILKKLNHPHILRILDAGFQDNIPYLVTEYAAGGSLRDLLKKSKDKLFSLDVAMNILTQIGQALHYIHERHIIHRDLKPENILFNIHGDVVLADFGIAVILASTSTGMVGRGGTPLYMAPEQFEGLVSAKSDQYALGCIAYELVTGHRLFSISAPSLEAYWYHHKFVEPPPPTTYQPYLPIHIEQAILTALAKDRTKRHRNISTFIKALLKNSNELTSNYAPLSLVMTEGTLQEAEKSSTTMPAMQQVNQVASVISPLLVKKLTLLHTLMGHTRPILSLAISADGQTVVSGSEDYTIKIWDLPTGKEVRTLTGHANAINSLAISLDGQTLVSGSEDRTIKIWDLPTGKEVHTLRGHGAYVMSVAISPDGQTLVSGGGDMRVKIWNLATGKEARDLSCHPGIVYAVAISRDGQTLISGLLDNTIKIWNLSTGKEVRAFAIRTRPILSEAISPDGQSLVSGSEDHTINIWNLASGKPVHTLTGHTMGVHSVTISPDGQTLVSGSADSTIKIWNLNTGKEVNTLTGHTGTVNSVAISPNGQMLVSGSDDLTIKVWGV